ncbi:hypothetical protein CASFOL_022055 [Castilleja foliolosa]|uniref:F-box domain-containing protein n=1 Tax=Castilleja foliolosa TaxID=1961234 RepID=A0ABD3CYD2_9LAMI
MDTQLVKRRIDDDDCSGITTDRLSQLPQPILHHILSLLSQRDAVRTSVLSKSWRSLWHGRLNVEFRDRDHCFNVDFLDKTLQRYLVQNLSLEQFLVDIHYGFHNFDLVDCVLLKKWIPVVIMIMRVRSLTLISYCNEEFPLPLVVFQSESLVQLHLQRCDLSILKSTYNVMLNNLQTLCLCDVDITDEIFEKIISSCPLIENLGLLSCNGLKSIKLHKHHNIKDFCYSVNDDRLTIIEFEDPHPLESVHIQNYRNWFLRHKNMQFPHLKSLDLFSVQLPAQTFDNFSSFFPCLNELSLNKCNGLKEFRLSSSSIKRLIMTNPRNMIKAFIDTPNILYFEYHGFLPSIKFTATSNEWKSEIFLWYKLIGKPSEKDTTASFLKLNKLLKALSQSHITLSLAPNEYKKEHFNGSYGGFYKPVVVEHLKFQSSSEPSILNCFFRICRPRYIHMDLYDDDMHDVDPELNNLDVFLSKLIPNEIGSYFWLKDLEEVGIEVRGEHAEDWHCVEGTSLLALPFQQQIRFRLTWRESS